LLIILEKKWKEVDAANSRKYSSITLEGWRKYFETTTFQTRSSSTRSNATFRNNYIVNMVLCAMSQISCM